MAKMIELKQRVDDFFDERRRDYPIHNYPRFGLIDNPGKIFLNSDDISRVEDYFLNEKEIFVQGSAKEYWDCEKLPVKKLTKIVHNTTYYFTTESVEDVVARING